MLPQVGVLHGPTLQALVLLLAGRLVSSATLKLRRNVDFNLQLSNFRNVQYVGPFSLGGGQTLPVVYDTGSFEILVVSARCAKCDDGLSEYDSSQSETFVSGGGVRAKHVFGSGPALSDLGYDSVWVGPPNSPYHVNNMTFWEIVDHNIAVLNENSKFAGIVGLCHPDAVPAEFSVASHKDINYGATLMQRLHVEAFAFCLPRSGGPEPPGQFSLGPSVSSMPWTVPGFATMPVVGKVHWGVMMTNVFVHGLEVSNPCNPSCGAIIDSGTSLIAAPPSAKGLIDSLKRMVNPDCSNIGSLPVLHFTVGGHTIHLPPQAYVMKASLLGLKIPVDPLGVWDFVWNGPKIGIVDQCTTAFMNIDKATQFGPLWILGMPFMRYYYTIFDRRSPPKIHVAPAGPDCKLPLVDAPIFANMTESATIATPLSVDLKAARLPRWASERRGDKLRL